jgi:rhodanese-related sulfurtransferase
MITQIRPAQLGDWLAKQKQKSADTPVLLDVRESWELQTASVQPSGFELLHIPMNTLAQRLGELPADRPIACLCHHGMRSMQVAYFLAQQGYEHLANITGGIDAWSHELDSRVPTY